MLTAVVSGLTIGFEPHWPMFGTYGRSYYVIPLYYGPTWAVADIHLSADLPRPPERTNRSAQTSRLDPPKLSISIDTMKYMSRFGAGRDQNCRRWSTLILQVFCLRSCHLFFIKITPCEDSKCLGSWRSFVRRSPFSLTPCPAVLLKHPMKRIR